MIKKKIGCIFGIIIAIIIITLSGYTLAKTTYTEEKLSEGASANETYIRLQDLYEKYYILCSYHGGDFSHLPSLNNVTLVTEEGSSEEGYLTPKDIGKQLFRKRVEDGNATTPFKQGTYRNETYAYYKVVEEKIATPMEAYILAEMTENILTNAGSDHYTYVQHAWWTTPAGSKGQTTVAPNELSKIASAFEEYINKVAVKESDGSIKYVEQEYTIQPNTEIIDHGKVDAPQINYKASINDDANQDGTINEYDKATASFDTTTGKYRVGPFSINYLDDTYKTESGKDIVFSGIEKFTLLSNLGEIPEDKWSFYWLKGERDPNAKTEMPTANEVFYIDIDYIEGLTEIVDIKVKFKYMNAGGKYEDLEGTYYKATWEAKSEAIWCKNGSTCNYNSSHTSPQTHLLDISGRTVKCTGGKACEHGKYKAHIQAWDFWVELTSLKKYTGQRIAAGLIGVRWYEEIELSLGAPNLDHPGKLKIIKKIDGDVISNNDFFDFDIFINGNFYDRVSVKPNEAYIMTIEWKDGQNPPTYEVREVLDTMPAGYTLVEIQNAAGTFIENGVVEVICVNKSTPITPPEQPNSGSLVISKKAIGKITDEEGNEKEYPTFTFELTIKEEGKPATTRTVTIKAGETYKTEEFVWYNQAPTYTVKEINVPENCNVILHNAVGSLIGGKEVWVNCTNSFREKMVELTMPMGGKVWEEEIPEFKDEESYANGIYDENEKGMSKVEVYIWKVMDGNRELATIRSYDNETILSQPLYTDDNGNWIAPRMSVPYSESKQVGYYDVEFVYDGQTYEPTTALVTAGGDAKSKINGNASTYMNASTSERDKYKNDSMALEDVAERDAFNNKFAEIFGKQAIDDNGNTIGAASKVDSLEYISKDYTTSGSDNTRKISTLVTLDNEGYVLDKFKMNAKVSTAGLRYPFDEKLHMKEYDKTIQGINETTKYIATDYYLQNINLGLVKREESDVSVTKDLYSAKVVVNNKMLTYNYNTAVNLEESPWNEALVQQIKVADQNISYDLKLYKSDYFYRTAIYDSNTMGYSDDVINQIKNVAKAGTEMEVYLTYKVTVRNESQELLATINKLADYYDSDLTLVSEDIVSKIDVAEANKLVRKDITVAEKTYYDVLKAAEKDKTPYSSEGATGRADWSQDNNVINGSDGKAYKKITTEALKDYKLESGEKINLYVTFKVNRTAVTEGVQNSVELGEKHNVAEITNYSTYYEDGKVAGRIDKDSAPDNVNIEKHNEKAWYEDDTDAAPIIRLNLYDEVRTVNGMAWEDSESKEIQYAQKIGDGIYQDGEKKISGMTVKLVEKVTVDDIDYDFIWPTEFNYNGTDLMKIMELKAQTITDENGNYEMKGVPAGNYIVRFVYGSTSDSKIVDDYMLAAEGDTTIENGYNGQDYKSTIYQTGFEDINTNGSGYLTNVWHDFTNGNLKDTRVSDARDDEMRRLEVVAYSRTINNTNSEVLSTADSKEANHEKLAKYTSMVANTAKLDIEVEYKKLAEESGVDTKVVDGTIVVNGEQINGTNYKYDIPNIDFGIEKRSSTVLKLDKQIDQITITSTNNNILLDVYYKHDYEIDENGNVKVTTTLDEENSKGFEHVQSINNMGTTQGFRYINIEEKLLQGPTITIKYSMTAFNVGEVDRTGELSKFNTGSEIIKEVINNKDIYRNNKEVQYGKYLGNIYYTGKGDSDAVVTTSVEQIIDYVDNNTVFNESKNSFIENNSWKTLSMEELLLGDTQKDILNGENNDYNIDNRGSMLAPEIYNIVDENGNIKPLTSEDVETLRRKIMNNEDIGNVAILDDNGTRYVTEQRNNIAVSINDKTYNPSLSTKLVPYEAYSKGVTTDGNGDKVDYKGSITLTTTRFISPEASRDDLQFNNLAEIIQFSNTVGRRDVDAKVANANPINGEFIAANGGANNVKSEHDTTATEIITLSAPTGVSIEKTTTNQILIIAFLSGIILIGGIYLIKKKVLDK